MISAPKRVACSRNRTMSSGPMTPSGNPGKFSTSVVSISWPPGWSLVDDGSPSSTRGLRLARAVYSAAVWPAGPEPMISTSRGSATLVLFVRVGQFPSTESVLAGGAPPRQPPEQQSEGCENAAEQEVHDPHAARDVAVHDAHREDAEQDEGDGAEDRRQQPEHHQAGGRHQAVGGVGSD